MDVVVIPASPWMRVLGYMNEGQLKLLRSAEVTVIGIVRILKEMQILTLQMVKAVLFRETKQGRYLIYHKT